MRKLKRLVAKRNMKAAGFTRICSTLNGKVDSFFSKHWRDYINGHN